MGPHSQSLLFFTFDTSYSCVFEFYVLGATGCPLPRFLIPVTMQGLLLVLKEAFFVLLSRENTLSIILFCRKKNSLDSYRPNIVDYCKRKSAVKNLRTRAH
jgi:hypothetical protein